MWCAKTNVVAAGDNQGKIIRLGVGLDQHLGAGLGGCVRVGGIKCGRLAELVLAARLVLAINLIGADVNETLDLLDLFISAEKENTGVNISCTTHTTHRRE